MSEVDHDYLAKISAYSCCLCLLRVCPKDIDWEKTKIPLRNMRITEFREKKFLGKIEEGRKLWPFETSVKSSFQEKENPESLT